MSSNRYVWLAQMRHDTQAAIESVRAGEAERAGVWARAAASAACWAHPHLMHERFNPKCPQCLIDAGEAVEVQS